MAWSVQPGQRNRAPAAWSSASLCSQQHALPKCHCFAISDCKWDFNGPCNAFDLVHFLAIFNCAPYGQRDRHSTPDPASFPFAIEHFHSIQHFHCFQRRITLRNSIPNGNGNPKRHSHAQCQRDRQWNTIFFLNPIGYWLWNSVSIQHTHRHTESLKLCDRHPVSVSVPQQHSQHFADGNTLVHFNGHTFWHAIHVCLQFRLSDRDFHGIQYAFSHRDPHPITLYIADSDFHGNDDQLAVDHRVLVSVCHC